MSGIPLLIMSIAGLLCCPILGPVAWFMANSALKSGTVPPQDVSTTNIARIIGMVATALWVIGILARVAGVGRSTTTYTRTGMSTANVPALVVTAPAGR